MSNMVSSNGIPNGPPQRGFGGTLTSARELPVSRRFDEYAVSGDGEIHRLTGLSHGMSFLLSIKGQPTFVHSDKLKCPNDIDHQAAPGDLVVAWSEGNGVWRISPLGNMKRGDWIGVDQASPLAPVHVGAGTAVNSINPAVLISRDETRSGENAHGYSDSTNFLGSSSAAYAAFDSRITVEGSGTLDHIAGFQTAETLNDTVTVNNHYGLYSALEINAGTSVNNRFGFFFESTTGSGTLGGEVGFYCRALSHGSSVPNYAIYCEADLGAGHASNSNIHNVNIGQSGGDYPSIGTNVTFTGTTGTQNYTASDYAAMIKFGYVGRIQTFTAGAGTAGGAITFTAGPEVVNGATSWSAPSDARLKDNVETLDVLARLDKFRAVSFDWKDPQRYRHDVGVIAQELVECFPEVVNEEQGDQPWGVEYDRLGAVALGGVKQLLEMVREQAREIDALKSKIGV